MKRCHKRVRKAVSYRMVVFREAVPENLVEVDRLLVELQLNLDSIDMPPDRAPLCPTFTEKKPADNRAVRTCLRSVNSSPLSVNRCYNQLSGLACLPQ